MSMQQNHYFMIGHKFDFDEFHQRVMAFYDNDKNEICEVLEKFYDSPFEGIHHHNDICILIDGYSGKYVYVGYVLKKSEDCGGLDDYINPKRRSKKYVSDKIAKVLGLENIKCDYLAFTHYR